MNKVTDEWADETSSHASDDVSDLDDDEDTSLALYDPSQETLADRFYALKDIVPPSTRATIAGTAASTVDWARWSARKVGGAAWIVTTTALLVGLPLMLSIEGEAMLVEQEKQFHAQQAGAGGAAPAYPGAPTGAPSQVPATGIVPPGF
ncbi:hypothetical protein MNV49_000200 [Pseudohyphozyma bogoriensis]|nr:hypothetical protein MNV49_000200 [Pseudohyphozyma bogoriensis]